MNSLICVVIFPILVSSCSTSLIKHEGPVSVAKVYFAKYDEVWDATLKALSKVTVLERNKEGGFCVTDWISKKSTVYYYYGNEKLSNPQRYRMTIRLAKGVKNNREAVKVKVYKDEQVQKEFYEGWDNVESDLIEEKIILYRIDRIIDIDRTLLNLSAN